MKKIVLSLILISVSIFACQQEKPTTTIEDLKAEVVQVEKDFAAMAAKEGLLKAFLHFAAEDAVINRNRKALKGKPAIRAYYEAQTSSNVKLEWEPEFVDVSKSGDLAYTYGPFTYSAVDTSGQTIESQGIFHTVWKKQADGKWRFVWD